MKILLDVVILIAGFIALIKGADWFVDGAAALAKKLKVPGLIIGLTVVAMGTSAPELAVSTSAAIQGANEIAVSNVVGSNLFNTLMVLGICALIHPIINYRNACAQLMVADIVGEMRYQRRMNGQTLRCLVPPDEHQVYPLRAVLRDGLPI